MLFEPKHRSVAAAAAATDSAELRTDMVTAADLTELAQLLRQDVAEVIQQLRVDMTGTTNSRIDMLSSITAALQNVAGKPTDSKQYRISDLIPRSWDSSNEKGEFRSFMSGLHLQAVTYEGVWSNWTSSTQTHVQ